MSLVKYLINKSTANVSMIGGSIEVPRGGYTVVPSVKAEDPEVVAASIRGWIEISESEPNIDPKGIPSAIEAELASNPFEGSKEFPKDAKAPVAVEDAADTQAKPASTSAAKRTTSTKK